MNNSEKNIVLPEYYMKHGPFTDPGEYAYLFDGISDTVPEIVEVIHGLLIHIFWTERYGMVLTEGQKEHVQTRHVSKILKKVMDMNPAPLNVKRPYEERFVGNCRDHSVLLTSILRHKGIPARARCGFAKYFRKGFFEDHWICEYWDKETARWISVDPQLDELQLKVLHVSFDPLDLPKGEFITGPEAWKLCREGVEDSSKFGIHDMNGLWFVRGDFIRDLAAMNKVELLPWDSWGLIEGYDDEMITKEQYQLLDQTAEIMITDDMQLYKLFEENEGFNVPAVINSYLTEIPIQVRLS
jgi:hypothetical protein